MDFHLGSFRYDRILGRGLVDLRLLRKEGVERASLRLLSEALLARTATVVSKVSLAPTLLSWRQGRVRSSKYGLEVFTRPRDGFD